MCSEETIKNFENDQEIKKAQEYVYALKTEIEATQAQIQTEVKKRFYVIASKENYFELFDAITRAFDAHSELWNLYTEYDPNKAATYRQDLLANLKKQAQALNKLLKRLHSILASLVSKRTIASISLPKFFIEDNKLPAPTDEELKRVRLPISMAEDLADLLQLTDKEMAIILTISIRTYHRLKLKGLFNPVASERLILLKELAAYGLEVFEDQTNFNQWLRLPLRELSNSSPLNLLHTATGFNRIKEILDRIEYGVYG